MECTNCGRKMRRDSIAATCALCSRVCGCGKPKDHRARECISCGMRRKALAQWADADMRAKMVSKLRVAKVKQRIGYGDLTLTSFCETKPDGRKYGRYRDAEGRRHMIFRSRWLWERANGPIPKGRLVHHKNLDPTDDRLENFELLTNPQHVSLHDGEENRRRRGKDKRPRKRAVALA